MTIIDLLKFIFEDNGRIILFCFALLAFGYVISCFIPKITIHKHYDKDDKPKG